MKKCPICQSTVKADMACPICMTTLTYEPEVEGKFEKKKLNKYLVFYLLKRFAFVILATAFCVIAGFFIQKYGFWIATAVTATAAFIISIFQRILTMHIKFRFLESFMWLIIYAIKYVALLVPVFWGVLFLIFN